jgi:hypothetical protein
MVKVTVYPPNGVDIGRIHPNCEKFVREMLEKSGVDGNFNLNLAFAENNGKFPHDGVKVTSSSHRTVELIVQANGVDNRFKAFLVPQSGNALEAPQIKERLHNFLNGKHYPFEENHHHESAPAPPVPTSASAPAALISTVIESVKPVEPPVSSVEKTGETTKREKLTKFSQDGENVKLLLIAFEEEAKKLNGQVKKEGLCIKLVEAMGINVSAKAFGPMIKKFVGDGYIVKKENFYEMTDKGKGILSPKTVLPISTTLVVPAPVENQPKPLPALSSGLGGELVAFVEKARKLALANQELPAVLDKIEAIEKELTVLKKKKDELCVIINNPETKKVREDLVILREFLSGKNIF